MYAPRHRSYMDWRTCSKLPGVSRIVAATMNIRATRSISELTGVSSIMALKNPSSDAPERTFDDLAATSLDIFPHTTEQQHVHFHWIGRR
ncbi:hypothetical protein TNCV_2458911 [Trichonephila clavipes]|nr:hypothetical protein TNCV_2458911 [Trichonephila clavipes]